MKSMITIMVALLLAGCGLPAEQRAASLCEQKVITAHSYAVTFAAREGKPYDPSHSEIQQLAESYRASCEQGFLAQDNAGRFCLESGLNASGAEFANCKLRWLENANRQAAIRSQAFGDAAWRQMYLNQRRAAPQQGFTCSTQGVFTTCR